MMRSDGRIQQYSVSGKTGTDGLHTGRQGQKSHSKAEMCSTFLLNTAASCSFFNIMDYSQIKSRAHYLPPVYKKNTNASFKDGVMRRSCFSLMLRTCGDGCCGRCHVGNSVWRWSRWGRKPRRRKLGKKKKIKWWQSYTDFPTYDSASHRHSWFIHLTICIQLLSMHTQR